MRITIKDRPLMIQTHHNPPQSDQNPLIPNTFAPVQRLGPNERAAIQAAVANGQV